MATADQTVSAVLEATNKAYIVETGDSSDGLSHYRRWSDGTIEQWGITGNKSSGKMTIVFLIEFSDTSYSFVAFPNEQYPRGNWAGWGTEDKTTSSLVMMIYGSSSGVAASLNNSWYAIGK